MGVFHLKLKDLPGFHGVLEKKHQGFLQALTA